uniref:Uncharacterized protein n=1 Tax=Populus trichocarpa TaxID=3694 RepID=A0A2K1YEI9_POPTR
MRSVNHLILISLNIVYPTEKPITIPLAYPIPIIFQSSIYSVHESSWSAGGVAGSFTSGLHFLVKGGPHSLGFPS